MENQLKAFRTANHLTQQQVADYLGGGVQKSFLSQIEHGDRKLPHMHLARLISNPYGWDASMLMGNVTANANNHSSASVSIGSAEVDNMRKEIERLKALLEEEKTRSAQYWEMIQKLLAR